MHNTALGAPLVVQPDEPAPRDEHEDGERAAMAQADYVPVPKWASSFTKTCEEHGMDDICWMNSSETPNSSILAEADKITGTDRNKSYGPPRDNHTRTAAMWQAYLSGLNGRPLDYRDVCWLNVLQKASRDVFCRKRDNLIDGCGFLRNIEMAENDEGR